MTSDTMTTDQLTRLQGQSVIDSMGQKIGDVQRIFYGQSTNQPAWVTVRGGRFGGHEAFIPLAGSQLSASGLAVAVRKEIVDGAPTIDAGTELTADDASKLDRYYEGMLSAPAPTQTPSAGPSPRQPEPEPAPRTPSGPTELTSFEEQLRVGTEPIETGTVRLRKHVVTEPVETSVPVRHEEVIVERVPAASSTPTPGHRFEEQAVEVTLHAERPTVSKETVPVETVRLTSKIETQQQQVSDQIRRERIEVEDQRSGGSRRR